jgi:hypothetical protein
MLMYVSDSQNLTMEYVILFITFRKKKKKKTQIRQITIISNTISSTNSEQLLTVRLSFGPSS